MIETTRRTATGALGLIRVAHAGRSRAGDARRGDEYANVQYFRAYYRRTVEEHTTRSEGRRGLETIKRQRRKARRERWVQGLRSLAQVLGNTEAAS